MRAAEAAPGPDEHAEALRRTTEAHDTDPRVNPLAPSDRASAGHRTKAQRQGAAEEFEPHWDGATSPAKAAPGETMTAMDVIEQALAAAGADLAEAHKKRLAVFRDAVAEAK